MELTPQQILDLKEELASSSAAQARISQYNFILRHIAATIDEAERFAYFSPKSRDIATAEQDRSDRDDPYDNDIDIPLSQQMVEDQRTVIGAMRSFRVPPPSAGQQAYAEKLEKAVSHLWREWNMPSFLSAVGWYAAVLGTAVGVLQWDNRDKLPRAVVRSPENCYALPSPDNETVPLLALFSVPTNGRILKRQYPTIKGVQQLDDDAEYDVVDYYDEEHRIRVIEDVDEPILVARNPLKRVPVYFFRNILIPNSLWGASSLVRAIPIENEINRLYSRQAKYLDMVMEAPTFIKDPENVPDNFSWNADTVVTMGPSGAIGKAPIAAIDPRAFEYRLEDMKQNLDKTMDFSNVARGVFEGSQLTAKGVRALAGFSMQRMMIRLQSVDAEIERMTEDALFMWHKGGGKQTRTIYGTSRGSLFTEPFNPRTDIDPGWIKVYVYVDAGTFVDRQSAQIANLQKLRGQPQAMSLQRFLELDPDCEDVQEEMERIRREQQEQFNLQMRFQTQAQTAQEQAYAAERGGAIEGAQPQAAPEAAPPAAPQAAPEEFAQGFIEVAVSDELDKQTILNYLAKTELAAAVQQQRVVFHGTSILERQPWIEVTPGTEGYEIQEGGVEVGEEAAPEEGYQEAAAGYGPEV